MRGRAGLKGFFISIVEFVYGGERYDGRNKADSGGLWIQ